MEAAAAAAVRLKSLGERFEEGSAIRILRYQRHSASSADILKAWDRKDNHGKTITTRQEENISNRQSLTVGANYEPSQERNDHPHFSRLVGFLLQQERVL